MGHPSAECCSHGRETAEAASMHVPDGVIEPQVAAFCGVLAAAGLAYSTWRLQGALRDRTTVLMGVMSACVFAAQMVNFPLWVAPVSGHLLGGVLAAVMLGPWGGASVIATVLLVQCLLCGDGGLTALGVNFVNMGLIGSVLGYAIYDPLRRLIGGRRGVLLGAMAAAWFSVLLASGAFAVELAGGSATRAPEFMSVFGWMVLFHALIGVGEAVITGMVVQFVLQTRPDLIYDSAKSSEGSLTPGARAARMAQVALGGLGMALAVGIFLAPLASEHPDGLEAVGQKLGFINEARAPEPNLAAPIPDYAMPGLVMTKALATAAAGGVGTLIVFGVGLALARSVATGSGTQPTLRTHEGAVDAA
jgi:cobalt/nickel transport system permease protein